MEAGPPFLQRLDLDPAADARAIRRAYARELKQVDQEHDAPGFQYLRDCYEAALAWAASKADGGQAPMPQAAAVPVPDMDTAADVPAAVPTPAARPGPVPQDYGAAWRGFAAGAAAAPAPSPELAPATLGRFVFDLFRIRFPSLGGQSPGIAEAAWREAMRAALADERLLNFDARLAFEQALAQLLAGGWQQGHEVLFPVAAELLGWDQDRRILARLGDAGALLDLALDERMGFAAQEAEERIRQRKVLAWLCTADAIHEHRFLAELPVLEQLMQRFPHWVPLIAPMAEFTQKRRHIPERHARDFEAAGTYEVAPERSPEMKRLVVVLKKVATVAALLMLALFVSFAVFGDRDTWNPRRAAGESPSAYRERLRNPQPLWKDEPVTQDRIDEIGRRVRYRPGPDAKHGPQRASFQVFLDEEGKIIGVNRKERAADPAFTEAVEKAILESAPFSSKTSKIFMVGYSVDRKRGVVRPFAATTRTLGPGPG